MSDCSTHRDEYPGVKRIRVFFTDPDERAFDWPFVPLEREIESIEVDGDEWVPLARMCKMADANGYLCTEVNRQQARIADLESLARDLLGLIAVPAFDCYKCRYEHHSCIGGCKLEEKARELGIEVDR